MAGRAGGRWMRIGAAVVVVGTVAAVALLAMHRRVPVRPAPKPTPPPHRVDVYVGYVPGVRAFGQTLAAPAFETRLAAEARAHPGTQVVVHAAPGTVFPQILKVLEAARAAHVPAAVAPEAAAPAKAAKPAKPPKTGGR